MQRDCVSFVKLSVNNYHVQMKYYYYGFLFECETWKAGGYVEVEGFLFWYKDEIGRRQ